MKNEKPSLVAARVTELREALGLSQTELAKRIGSTQQSIDMMERGKVSRPTKLHELARALRTDVDYLLGAIAPREVTYSDDDPHAPEPMNPDAQKTWDSNEGPRGIPLDASAQIDVTAGMGGGGITIIAEGVPGKSGMTFSNDVIADYWRLPPTVMTIRPRDVAIIPVQGDSMLPTLVEGDYVFVDTRHRFPSPDGVYAIADEFGGIVVKRLELSSRPGSAEKTIRIISDNPKHAPKEWALDEVQIIGRVMRRFSAVG